MTKIQIQPNAKVQAELQSRGVTTRVGVYGQHKVQIGSAPPVSLDKVAAPSLPFSGFSKAAKLRRGQIGVYDAATSVLATLSKPGALDARKLVDSMQMMEGHISRLHKQGELRDPQNSTFQAFAPCVETMDNAQLAAAYQCFNSAEFDLLQTALKAEARANPDAHAARSVADKLFDLQALVLKEVSDRICRGQNLPGADALPCLSDLYGPLVTNERVPFAQVSATDKRTTDISAANLQTLVTMSAQSATSRERTAAGVDADLKRQKMSGISARDIGDVMRFSELTVNISGVHLFGRDSSLGGEPKALLPNIFHLNERGITPKRTGYLDARDSIEKLMFPALTEHEIRPDERPTYAALNLRKSVKGAVGSVASYGGSVIVLKPEVARRATYTIDDTFYSPKIAATPARRDSFYALLPSAAGQGISLLNVVDCCKQDSEMHGRLENLFDYIAAKKGCQLADITGHPAYFDLCKVFNEGVLTKLIVQAFGDREGTQSAMATYDNIEALLPHMEPPTRDSIARVLDKNEQEYPRILLGGGVQYIEAQVHGGISPLDDIAEIRLFEDDFETDADKHEAQVRAEKFTEDTGIPVTWIGKRVLDREGLDASALESRNIAFSLQHRDLDSAADEIFEDFAGSVAELFSDSADIPEEVRTLRGEALVQVATKFRGRLAEERVNPSPDLPLDGKAATRQILKEVALPMLERKSTLYAEMQKRVFDTTGQKAAFLHWVLSAGVLRDSTEMGIIFSHAMQFKKDLLELASRDPAASAEDLMKALVAIMASLKPKLDEWIGVAKIGDFGPENRYTEFSRVAFMGIAMLENISGGSAALQKMSALVNGPEMSQAINTLHGLSVSKETASLPGLEDISTVSNFLYIARELIVSSATKRAASRVADFEADLVYVPTLVRKTIRMIGSNVADGFDARFPAPPAFPTPAKPELLPVTDTRRREFLVHTLDAYKPLELNAERGVSTHGRGHIARTFIFASALCNILSGMGISVDKTAVLCGISGHDMGRKGGGMDTWETQSADMLCEAMQRTFGKDSMGSEYETALGNCIITPKGDAPLTVEAMVLHSADALDIGRIGAKFDLGRFGFLQTGKGTRSKGIERMCLELEKEATMLQYLTNPLCRSRPFLDAISKAMEEALGNNDMVLFTGLQGARDSIREEIENAFIEDLDVPAEKFMRSVENAIARNRDLFPLLSRLYALPVDEE